MKNTCECLPEARKDCPRRKRLIEAMQEMRIRRGDGKADQEFDRSCLEKT